jgi:hypothetical protein
MTIVTEKTIKVVPAGGVSKISELEIDSNKDWAAKNITNFGAGGIDLHGVVTGHASRHADGGADEIVSPLDLAAIPSIHQALIAQGTTDISTTSTTYVDVPDLSITITTGANPVLIMATISGGASVPCHPGLAITIDGTRKAVVHDYYYEDAHTGGSITAIWLGTLTADSHTIKAQWKINTTGTIYILPTTYPNEHSRGLIVIEMKK